MKTPLVLDAARYTLSNFDFVALTAIETDFTGRFYII